MEACDDLDPKLLMATFRKIGHERDNLMEVH